MSNVIEMKKDLDRMADEAYLQLESFDITTRNCAKLGREGWLTIGRWLIQAREKYPSDQEYGRAAKEKFPKYKNNERGAAMWWANLEPRQRVECAERWPQVYCLRVIRDLFKDNLDDEEDFSECVTVSASDSFGVPLNGTPPEVEPSEPENVEIAGQKPEIQPEPVTKKSEDGADQVKKSVLQGYISDKENETLCRFYPKHKKASRVAITVLKKMADAKQIKFVQDLIKVIESGGIGESNPIIYTGETKPIQNARLIHFELPFKFASQWEFIPERPGKIFKEMLNNAEVIYQVGEAIKHIPRNEMAQREAKAAEVWNNLHRALIVTDEPAVESCSPPAAPRHEDLIKICGVQFWPQTEYQPKAEYDVVWAAAHLVDEVHRQFHLTCKMPIADAIMATKQLCRALRLFNREGGQLILAMLTAMGNHKELIADHTATPGLTHSGKPPAFDT